MSLTCLSTEEKRTARSVFKRYHAALQVDNDARIVWLGAVIYALALRPILAKPAPIGGLFVAFKVFLLGLSTLWPFALRLWSYEWLLRWRDEFFIGHWLLHHVVGPRVLVAAGVNFRTNLVSSKPLLFFLGFWFSRPTMWSCGNMVTYRMKFYLFSIVQPIILALQWPEERRACRASAMEYPVQTSAAFGNLAMLLRSFTRSSSWSETTPNDDAMSICCKVDAFLIVLVALVLPGVVIWYLEQETWREFARVDPGVLTWEGGPDARQISLIQKKIRKAHKHRANYYYSGYDGRIIAIGFVVAATFWQLLDAPVPFSFVSSSII